MEEISTTKERDKTKTAVLILAIVILAVIAAVLAVTLTMKMNTLSRYAAVNERLHTEMVAAQEERDALQAEVAQNENLQSELDAANEKIAELQRLYDAAIATPEPVSNQNTSPWNTPLPDGLTAELQLVDDDCTLLIHYANNTGSAISLTTYCAFADERGDTFMQSARIISFLADGTEYIVAIDAYDEIKQIGLDYEIGNPLRKISEANEALSVSSQRNGDGSVSATFSSPDGASVSGGIFFLAQDGSVLGYQPFSIGFLSSMDYYFDAPDFEYDDYLLCYEAMS